MVTNLQLVKFLEGYGLLQKTPLLKYQQKKFGEIEDRITMIKNTLRECENENQETKAKLEKILKEEGVKEEDLETLKYQEMYLEIHKRYAKLLYIFGQEYPPYRQYVLPTSFGNAIRAFESYSCVVYGIDAVAVWSRIIQFASNDHKKSISETKAQMDFAVNLYFVLIIVFVEYLILAVITISIPSIWFPVVVFFFSWFSYKMTVNSAKVWGEDVKTVFDLYRYDLLRKMEILCVTKANEREKWEEISRMFVYWSGQKTK
jgi:hypothetical protein